MQLSRVAKADGCAQLRDTRFKYRLSGSYTRTLDQVVVAEIVSITRRVVGNIGIVQRHVTLEEIAIALKIELRPFTAAPYANASFTNNRWVLPADTHVELAFDTIVPVEQCPCAAAP